LPEHGSPNLPVFSRCGRHLKAVGEGRLHKRRLADAASAAIAKIRWRTPVGRKNRKQPTRKTKAGFPRDSTSCLVTATIVLCGKLLYTMPQISQAHGVIPSDAIK